MPGSEGAPVLVVDDEPEIRALARLALELEGFEVVEAEDGPSALAAARARRPLLVFLDLMLPVMDGWAILAELQADEELSGVPVVLLTAVADDAAQLRGWGAGVLDFLSKPFQPSTLVAWAHEALLPRDPELEAARRARIVEQLSLLRDLRR